jgi:outer membrane protein assembly factor BamD (BamD/ComL family)
MGNEEKAIASFSQIVEKYPGSEYFQLAELELKKDLK